MASGIASAVNGSPTSSHVILLGDAHPLFRSGMRYLLQDGLAPVEVVEAGTRGDVLALLERGSVDLVLTSLFSAEGDWDRFLADLLQCAPAGRLVILSSIDEPTRICRVLSAGAAGYVFKQMPSDIALQAIRLVLAGGIYVPPAALAGLHAAVPPGATPAPPPVARANGVSLNGREQAILGLIVQGASNKTIARSLGLSAGTVKAHVASLLRLYGAGNRTELVIAATKHDGRPSAAPDAPRSRRPG